MARGKFKKVRGDIFSELESSKKIDPNKLELMKNHEQEFILCANDFWYFAQFIKTYDEENEKIRPFPNYQYLVEDVHKPIEEHQKVIIFKSRRLLISWYCTLRQFWRAKFAGTGAARGREVFRGAFMSVGEVEAKELLDRVAFAEHHLPQWLQDKNPLIVNNELEMRWASSSDIKAFPLKRTGPRTFGFTEVFFDEMAFQEAVRSVYTGMAPTLGAKGKLIAASTPNGRYNLFHDIWTNKNKKYNDMYRIELDWDLHPEHDEEWLKHLTASMDEQMIAREIFKSFSIPEGDPVWPEYNSKMHKVNETQIYDNQIMLIGWDFGFHFPAAVFMQPNHKDQLVGHMEICGEDESFDRFCERVLRAAEALYHRERIMEIHCCPRDGMHKYRTRSRSGAVNDVSEIRNVWGVKSNQIRFAPEDKQSRSNESARMKETRKLWRLRADGEPGMYFHKRMEMLHDGFMGGYCYPEKGGESPLKNEYSHPQDAVQHIVTVFNRLPQTRQKQRQEKQEQEYTRRSRRSKWRTGIPIRD